MTQSTSYDVRAFVLTVHWMSRGLTPHRTAIVCQPGTCPEPTVSNPTINFSRVDSMFYFDLGVNWNYTPKTQFYMKVDNLTNIRPPDVGGQDNNQVLYDVNGRMFRFGVRLNY